MSKFENTTVNVRFGDTTFSVSNKSTSDAFYHASLFVEKLKEEYHESESGDICFDITIILKKE